MAVVDAISYILDEKLVSESPLKQLVASVSVGLFNGQIMLDLDYLEDSGAETDMNFVMTASGQYIEIQGTGEERDFSRSELLEMMNVANIGIKELIEKQEKALALNND